MAFLDTVKSIWDSATPARRFITKGVLSALSAWGVYSNQQAFNDAKNKQSLQNKEASEDQAKNSQQNKQEGGILGKLSKAWEWFSNTNFWQVSTSPTVTKSIIIGLQLFSLFSGVGTLVEGAAIIGCLCCTTASVVVDATRVYGLQKLNHEVNELHKIKDANMRQHKLLLTIPEHQRNFFIDKINEYKSSVMNYEYKPAMPNSEKSPYAVVEATLEAGSSVVATLSPTGFTDSGAVKTAHISAGAGGVANVYAKYRNRQVYDIQIKEFKDKIDHYKHCLGLHYESGDSIISLKQHATQKQAENYAIKQILLNGGNVNKYNEYLNEYSDKKAASYAIKKSFNTTSNIQKYKNEYKKENEIPKRLWAYKTKTFFLSLKNTILYGFHGKSFLSIATPIEQDFYKQADIFINKDHSLHIDRYKVTNLEQNVDVRKIAQDAKLSLDLSTISTDDSASNSPQIPKARKNTVLSLKL